MQNLFKKLPIAVFVSAGLFVAGPLAAATLDRDALEDEPKAELLAPATLNLAWGEEDEEDEEDEQEWFAWGEEDDEEEEDEHDDWLAYDEDDEEEDEEYDWIA